MSPATEFPTTKHPEDIQGEGFALDLIDSLLKLGNHYTNIEIQILEANGNAQGNGTHGPFQSMDKDLGSIEFCPAYQPDEAGHIVHHDDAYDKHWRDKVTGQTQIRWVIHPPVNLP